MTEQTKYVWLVHSPNVTSSQDQEEKQITGRVVSRIASNVKISAKYVDPFLWGSLVNKGSAEISFYLIKHLPTDTGSLYSMYTVCSALLW